MNRWIVATVPLAACVSFGEPTPVGVTLDDGQLLVGDVTTDVLALDGAFGDVLVPIDDVGMVVPVEGRSLGDSNGHVTVWLRNGSELRGEWAEPELAMTIEVGGDDVPVDVPADRLQALQLRGGEEWPDAGLYRVRTTWGDDFLVDPAETRIAMQNDLGEFAPFLSECRSVGPIGDPTGDWRIELETGTVLVGALQQEAITFALPMGPDEIVVPLEALAVLDRGSWGAPAEAQGIVGGWLSASPSPAAEMAPPSPRPVPASVPARQETRARPGLSSGEGWFDNRRLEDAKK
jgi:hypothetical protein